jgi:phosphoadenosine phosphosulfate reductase
MSEVSESFAEQLVQQIPNAVISYSGGKDSAVLGDILTRFGLTKVFIDTGLEFSETYEYIDKLRAEGHKIDIVRASTSFYSLVKEKGFPKAGNRWCCKTQKFEPFSRYIGERYSNQDVIVFIAERRCEAAYRTSEPFVRRHRYIPNQLTAQPLLDWLTLDIWNHIWTKGLSINPVYEFFDRSGCWLCPFGLQHRIFLLEFSHPKLHKLLLSMRLTKLKQEKERGAFANKKPCTMLLEGKRVKTCNVYGHFYVDSICHRCGLAEGSVPGVSTTTSAPEPEPLKPP